jgi:hypothetical protein
VPSVLRCVGHVPLLPDPVTCPSPPVADALLLWALRLAMEDETGREAARRGLELAGARAAWPHFQEVTGMVALALDRPLHVVREAVALAQAGALTPARLRLREGLPATVARFAEPPLWRFARHYANAGLICRIRLDLPLPHTPGFGG